ncbi:MAG: NADH:flavin oxidoreductase/NADH oxidase [Rhodoblastus sp.]|nr:MAG: NADH:flavin oxidoreductase/NADH oxidase [Rhodoblastus sp.]
MSTLFSPLTLGPVPLPNRIAVAPMCQYAANDGVMADWHLQHLMTLAMSGAGLVTVEATAVERRGRITPRCCGLYSDDAEAAMARVIAAARAVALPGVKFAVQLAHAGRKASTAPPFEGGKPLTPDQDAWATVSASALPFADGWPPPLALDAAGMARVKDAFVDAARRAARVGFDAIELHMTHGYLLAQFLSPLSNLREDAYGGSLENRMRFPLEVADAVAAVLPASMAWGARITGSEWLEGGITPDEAAALARALKGRGAAFVCVSSGGNSPLSRIPATPGYQVPFAAHVKAHAGEGLAVRAVGLIVAPREAEAILERGEADWIALGRAFLDDPRWGWRAAQTLGQPLALPPRYARAAPTVWPGAAWLRGTV